MERFISPYHVPGAYDGPKIQSGGETVVSCGGLIIVSGAGEVSVTVEGVVVVTGEGVVVAAGVGKVVVACVGEIEGTIKEFLGYIPDNQDGDPKEIDKGQNG